MKPDSKIYIAGHTGMVGSALVRNLRKKGFHNIIGKSIEELDLTNQQAVVSFFKKEQPEYIILAAAKVGGIQANNVYRAQFIYENLMIQNNLIHQSYLHGVKKLLFLGSSCIYPKECPQPIKEEYLLTGLLEPTNEPYAIAKIAGIKMCESYYRQYGCNFIAVMPTNLYGPNDNYDLGTSHVMPAILRKMHLGRCLENNDWEAIRTDLNKRPIEGIKGADTDEEILRILGKYGINYEFRIMNNGLGIKNSGLRKEESTSAKKPVTITLWGTGEVYREFMHVDDMAEACVQIMGNTDANDLAPEISEYMSVFVNIGTGIDHTIAETAEIIKDIVGFSGKIQWDRSKPDGMFKKLLDVSKLKNLGYDAPRSLEEGIRSVYENYLHNQY